MRIAPSIEEGRQSSSVMLLPDTSALRLVYLSATRPTDTTLRTRPVLISAKASPAALVPS